MHELDLSAGPAQRERVEHDGGAHVLCELPLGWQHLLRAKRPEDMDLKYGLNLLFTDKGIRPDEMARAMEDAGYESLWIGDHSHIPVSLKAQRPFGGTSRTRTGTTLTSSSRSRWRRPPRRASRSRPVYAL